MFRDYDKYLSASLKVYIFVLVIIFIMKLVGLDYFGLDMNNTIILKLNDFCLKYHLDFIWYSITLYFNLYFCISVASKNNSNKLKLKMIFPTIIFIFLKFLENIIANGIIIFLIDFIYGIVVFLICEKFKNLKQNILKIIKISLLVTLYQIITLVIRNVNYVEENSFLLNCLLSIDYFLMLLITYKIYFLKGDKILCGMVQCSSSLKKMNLKKSLTKLQKKLHKFSEKEKVEKLTIIFYIILSLIWNTLSLVIVLIVAKLNHTFVECIFILTSFWLSKRAFGKAFHLKSMVHCFIVSNLTYYALNRLTTPLGISMVVPILLGVGLSYTTSKLVKKTYKPLYRGMPKDLFEETILKIVDKDSIKYKICYNFYIKNKSDLSLSFQYNYSIAGIRKIRTRINERIKKLE